MPCRSFWHLHPMINRSVGRDAPIAPERGPVVYRKRRKHLYGTMLVIGRLAQYDVCGLANGNGTMPSIVPYNSGLNPSQNSQYAAKQSYGGVKAPRPTA